MNSTLKSKKHILREIFNEASKPANRPYLLKCDTASFGVSAENAEANDNTKAAVAAAKASGHDMPVIDQQKREYQTKRVHAIFDDFGWGGALLPATPGRLDESFTADSVILLRQPDGRLTGLFSKFRNPSRPPEVQKVADFVTRWEGFDAAKDVIVPSQYHLEGTGDNVYDPFRDIFWSGYALQEDGKPDPSIGRSDIRAHKQLTEVTGVEVLSLEVKKTDNPADKTLYHADTFVLPLPLGHVAVYKGGLKDDAYAAMIDRCFTQYGLDPAEYLIEVTKEDAEKFALNGRSGPVSAETIEKSPFVTARPATDDYCGFAVVIPECSADFQQALASKGYAVAATPLDVFIEIGGGAGHCMSNNLNEQRIEGGYARKLGFPTPKKPLIAA